MDKVHAGHHKNKGFMYFERIMIEPTSTCTMGCSWCPHPKMSRRKAHAEKESLLTTIEEIARSGMTGRVAVVGVGEPLANPEYENIIENARPLGLEVSLQTNGYSLSRLAKVKGKVLELRISLQTITAAAYRTKNYSVAFEKYLSTILDFVVQHADYHKVVLSVLLIRNNPIKYLFIGAEDHRPIFLQIFRLRDFVNRLSALMNAGVIRFNPLLDNRIDITPNLEVNIDEFVPWLGDVDLFENEDAHVASRTRRTPGGCRLFKSGSMILSDGRVCMCCRDAEGRTAVGQLERGKGLADILNSDKYGRIHRAFEKEDIIDPFCQLCKGANRYKFPVNILDFFDRRLMNRVLV
jgi:organic radical activating enzyme